VTYITPKKERASAESAYLTPEVLQRPNLTVAIQALATRVIFVDKKAVGVEFVNTSTKKLYRVNVSGEVVLS